MIREEEIAELKKHLDVNGKLVITDDMSDTQKERYQFINSLDVDLVELLSRKSDMSIDPADEEEEPDFESDDSDLDDDDEAEVLDDTDASEIQEDHSDFQDGLDNFF